ncbi:small nuclear ribonucleoprotein Sm-D3 (nucleomorph) [Lotharella oceanica]|uniref:Small nuclear ribonucleoprotein Sm-D3 n=1 Tax=Lotharella oceanica TaxID=641309 RepID=A0A060DAU9_9EUKA|nr:small nuclear ribonucleoprotein Sm-D3 [Lotharella oceanica]|mmetsp:Transcript_2838/g.5396  ORF Transcript_2838/g.5396 Transcript_2838/m.5396 type:complete len:123 (-) Transcript_2838:342-710(-)
MSDAMSGIGIPIKLIHESEKHNIGIVMKNGDYIKGELHNSEDNWNLCIKDAVVLTKFKIFKKSFLFIRGNQIRYLSLPEILKNAPMFKSIVPINKNNNLVPGMGILGRSGASSSLFKSTDWK